MWVIFVYESKNFRKLFWSLVEYYLRSVIFLEFDKLLTGKTVTHIKLGVGQIESIDAGHLEVRFNEQKISRFIYPDAFEKYLKLEDETVQNIVNKHLRVKHLLEAEERRRKKQELNKLDDEIRRHHQEELARKKKASLAKYAKEKRINIKIIDTSKIS